MAQDLEATATASPQRGDAVVAVRRSPMLFVVLHCENPELGGARHALADVDEVLVVRGATRAARRELRSGVRTLVLQIPGSLVSREHARLVRVGATWMLLDLGSRNGTYRAGGRVERVTLQHGDVFECGRTLFSFAADLELEAELAADVAPLPGDPLATVHPTLEARHRRLAAVARSPLPVLLLGASGTGKEVLARAIHEVSARPRAFVPMNCAALPEGLLESQLFGHVKGAFSGAVRDELGYFRAAEGGTLFLDELGDLPLRSQAAFLRALEESVVVPVGSTRPVPVDVRVIAATNRPLDELVARGLFREDLLARLAGYTHRLPALADRRVDLGLLIAALLPRVSDRPLTFEPGAALALLGHEWPLNVRELRHTLASAAVLAAGAPLDLVHVTASWTAPSSRTPVSTDRASALRAALRTHGGNIAAVARAFGKAPAQVHRWLKQHEIDPNEFRSGR